MSIDLDGSLRRLKPHKRTASLQRRPDEQLTFVQANQAVGPALLLDTNVYIDTLEGSSPPEVDVLIRASTLVHLSVVISELTHNFGRLNPHHAGTRAILKQLTKVIKAIPAHQLKDDIPASVMAEAGIMTGLLFRCGGYHPGQEMAAQNDATIYLYALARGYTVLTRNIRDFDHLQQILPAGRVLFYRKV